MNGKIENKMRNGSDYIFAMVRCYANVIDLCSKLQPKQILNKTKIFFTPMHF